MDNELGERNASEEWHENKAFSVLSENRPVFFNRAKG